MNENSRIPSRGNEEDLIVSFPNLSSQLDPEGRREGVTSENKGGRSSKRMKRYEFTSLISFVPD